ncbi:MAG TPA: hypothetical protein VFA33_03325 [Bryobacteraceae bacterium]|nr:hypothetical protein [Bryobacteraceae bacterium]
MVHPNVQPGSPPPIPPAPLLTRKHTGHELGATEDQVNMRATLPQRVDSHGSKIEEMAGTGEVDAQGG